MNGVPWACGGLPRPHPPQAATLAPYATLRLHNSGVDVYELTPDR